MQPASPPRASVLIVCTGNICRSPAAEYLLRAALGAGAGIEVASAGLDARLGEPVAGPMARLLGVRGIDASGFAARQLRTDEAAAADVVLTMTAEQRAAVVSRVPRLVRRTFTLPEFAGLAELVTVDPSAGPAQRLGDLVRAVPRARALRATADGTDDVEDPYRRSDETFARVLDRIERSVGVLVAALRGPAVSSAAAPTGASAPDRAFG